METFKKLFAKEVLKAVVIIGPLLIILFFMGLRISKITGVISGNIQDILDRSASAKLVSVIQVQYESKGQKYLQTLQNVVPPKDSLIDLQKEIQSLAAQENVGFGFTFLGEKPVSDSGLGSVSYRANIQGSDFNSLLRFLRRLAGFRYLNSLDSVSISRQESGLQMVTQGEVYFR